MQRLIFRCENINFLQEWCSCFEEGYEKKCSGRKIDLKWLGPYKIIKTLGRGIYRVLSIDDPSQIVPRVHGIHLKPYHSPDGKVCTLEYKMLQEFSINIVLYAAS